MKAVKKEFDLEITKIHSVFLIGLKKDKIKNEKSRTVFKMQFF